MPITSSKCYGHEIGLSCAFRQWRADSHCRFIHGYALSFKFEFGCHFPDKNGWVVDFGALKNLKKSLQEMFDHKTVVAKSDPEFEAFMIMHEKGIMDVLFIDEVGCEAFAKLAYQEAVNALRSLEPEAAKLANLRCYVISAECSEHGANSAKFIGVLR